MLNKTYEAYLDLFKDFLCDNFDNVADRIEFNEGSYLHDYYYGKYDVEDNLQAERDMWEEIWTDMDKALEKLFK